jgi:hypothetical protein
MFQWFQSFLELEDLFSGSRSNIKRKKLVENSSAILLKRVRLFERFERLERFEQSGVDRVSSILNPVKRRGVVVDDLPLHLRRQVS